MPCGFTLCLVLIAAGFATAAAKDGEKVVPHIKEEAGHPWRPPFGLKRIGRPFTAVVELSARQRPRHEYTLAAYRNGEPIGKTVLALTEEPPYVGKANFDTHPDELVLFVKSAANGKPIELKRKIVEVPEFVADAVARPETLIHPVDLGTVLVPSDWLLLRGDQKAGVRIAALSRTKTLPGVRAVAWFASAPENKQVAVISLNKDRVAQVAIQPIRAPATVDRDFLHVALIDTDDKELWHKRIRTMVVCRPPRWPAFGATETRLRYDAPISVRDAETGKLTSIKYEDAWPPHLKDIVVSLPNGSRFVFWRGASYIPFWAGRHNTGVCYEWAELLAPMPKDRVDCIEPLMDKELRYGKVQVVTSTHARVHVRWSYQSTDFNYNVWGDSAAEDFYFYPDGFGTRVLTLRHAPGAEYELSEFIVLTPQGMYPLDVLPPKPVQIIFVDGHKREVPFPFLDPAESEKPKSRDMPAIYRIRPHKDESFAAIYFSPYDKSVPPLIFSPFFDQGSLVTPAYWGSHWPLARGKTTGSAIDDRLHLTPCHISLMSWARTRPSPLARASLQTLDTRGRSRTMIEQQWVWLIGMSDASDTRLLEWAHSFGRPASLEVEGARCDLNTYVPQRRVFRLRVEDETVAITITPAAVCVNPVFELLSAPKNLVRIKLGNRLLEPGEYAWDGHTLWLDLTITKITQLQLSFGKPKPKPGEPKPAASERSSAGPIPEKERKKTEMKRAQFTFPRPHGQGEHPLFLFSFCNEA